MSVTLIEAIATLTAQGWGLQFHENGNQFVVSATKLGKPSMHMTEQGMAVVREPGRTVGRAIDLRRFNSARGAVAKERAIVKLVNEIIEAAR